MRPSMLIGCMAPPSVSRRGNVGRAGPWCHHSNIRGPLCSPFGLPSGVCSAAVRTKCIPVRVGRLIGKGPWCRRLYNSGPLRAPLGLPSGALAAVTGATQGNRKPHPQIFEGSTQQNRKVRSSDNRQLAQESQIARSKNSENPIQRNRGILIRWGLWHRDPYRAGALWAERVRGIAVPIFGGLCVPLLAYRAGRVAPPFQ